MMQTMVVIGLKERVQAEDVTPYDHVLYHEPIRIKYQLEDYSSFEHNIFVFYDNINAINLSKNLIQHSKVKHIEISIFLVLSLLILIINELITSLNLYQKIILTS
ncbi:hypothetical protein CR513_54520, partial [Mucuna pruriens]